ncbi:hypothetical protein GCM10025857_38720 [Alicyclobacillus contaminans]|uniref:hypothetical protein n=1 Tax=Alicyclobacillus contaminans TaxID=392016 RepID=UPI000419A122|nr:hypothetical protein [Alicyclobacillus contaminans]GMA52515.1 hypothetical protein GCM10025857_38720 [Alicyclobacillus contaminans]
MSAALAVEDLLALAALLAGVWLVKAGAARKVSGKMDTLKVQKVCRRFMWLASVLCVCIIGFGGMYQAGVLRGVSAYAGVGGAATGLWICLQVFKQRMR